MLPLKGRVALVTGSGRNIGRAIALGLARAGADLVVHARASRDEVESVAAEARALGRRALPFLVDVRDEPGVRQMIATATGELGTVDVLVNSAALRRERRFEDLSLDEWREILSVVLDGAFICSRAALPGMVERGGGTVINVIGLTGQTGARHRAHVVTGKAGLIGLTKALALEYADRGVTVNGVSPGMIQTERDARSAALDPAHRRDRVVPVGRLGQPDEVASLCCYLAGPDARFITGQILSVSGGAYL